MDANTILELVRAGYTKDEIEKMVAKPEESSESDKTVSGEQSETTTAHDIPIDNSIGDILKPLQEEIAKLGETVKAIQDSNIKNASTDSPKKDESIKEIMDGFISQL